VRYESISCGFRESREMPSRVSTPSSDCLAGTYQPERYEDVRQTYFSRSEVRSSRTEDMPAVISSTTERNSLDTTSTSISPEAENRQHVHWSTNIRRRRSVNGFLGRRENRVVRNSSVHWTQSPVRFIFRGSSRR
jgi:hypothetical protein